MKRTHRRWHRRAWVLLAPVLLLVIGLAMALRPAEPHRADLPASLQAPATGQGR
jgi:hypothetical protein